MLTTALAFELRNRFGTPLFVYDEETLRRRAESALGFPNFAGLTVRYAIKANPQAAILRLFNACGLQMDASSTGEAFRAMAAGIPGEHISLSSQQLDPEFTELVDRGVRFVATSLNQLRRFGESFPGGSVAARFNPGFGSGQRGKTNVGGPEASFGIWHQWVPEVHTILREFDLKLGRIHTHVGSGVDPDVWQRVAEISLRLVDSFPSVTTLDLGGGFKVDRMSDPETTDLAAIGRQVSGAFKEFDHRTGRRIQLEIEPGTWLVAHAGELLATVQDIVSTGKEGHEFLKLDTGMTEILRPSLYGAQHPMRLWTQRDAGPIRTYVVVGHCCESGDILSPADGDPATVARRELPQAEIGDLLSIGGAGAYCASMAATHYNSFPTAAEVWMPAGGGRPCLVRRRGRLEDIWRDELPVTKYRLAEENR